MNLETIAPKHVYDILLEQKSDGSHQASVLGWSACYASGDTEEHAIDSLRQVLINRLKHTKILQLEVSLDVPQQPTQSIVKPENPWTKFSGIFKDDPVFDEMLDSIAQYREELDAELAREQEGEA